MADTVPVSDVLLEAIDYLSKLGSNLRLRSENLKERRLRKDKLRNTHAVQKAAKKVLLICELSKKSILNVETGVKNVLSEIDASQGSSNAYLDKSHYFIYESQKLRIRRKVNLKHFTSVKVLAKATPLSTLDKYPIYYHCKLYQTRKEREKEKKKEECTKDILEDGVNDNHSLSFSNLTEKGVDQLSTSSNKIIEEHKGYDEPDTAAGDQRDKTGKNEIIKKSSDTKKTKKCRIVIDSSDSDSDTRENLQSKGECENKPVDSMTVCELVYNKEADIDKEREDSLQHINKDVNSCDDNCQIPILNKEISNDMSAQSSNCETAAKHVDENLINLECVQEQPEVETIKTNKECKRDINTEKTKIPDSDSDKLDSNKIQIADKKCNDNIDVNPHTESNDACITNTVSKRIGHEKISLFDNDNSQGSTESRPFIKCVNINKLLREDKLPKEIGPCIEIDSDTDEETVNVVKEKWHKKNDKHRSKLRNRKKISKKCANTQSHITRRTSSESSQIDDEDYWIQKRKEVKDFKPKSFNINVSRIPKLTEMFLRENHLKRITQSGYIVCELSFRNDKEQELNIPLEKEIIETNESSSAKDNINVAKNALLNLDSDSDCDVEAEKINKIKQALLQDSDTENEEIENQNAQLSNAIDISNETNNSACSNNNSQKNSNVELETNKIDEEIDKNEKCTNGNSQGPDKNKVISDNEPGGKKKDNNNEKSTLNSNSSDENVANRTLNGKRRRKSCSSSSSKRRKIMDSMEAKKMLLNCSSSSETEEEHLKNVINNIQDTLLIEYSDEEDETKKKVDSDVSSSKGRKRKTSEDSKHSIRECDSSTKDSNSIVEENSSTKKMGRSKTKPPGSSSQNTDSQESLDKTINWLTNLKTLTKKRRRQRLRRRQRQRQRRSTSTESSSSRSQQKMPKTPHISEEGFLKAESSSDAASLADSDVGEEVEIPAVSLPGLNGDSLVQLAKNDLLEESNSSSSPEKSSEDVKKEDESEEENVKARRRKANAISSDSEVGGSHKKERVVKTSDFEDSDDDSEPAKKSKRKKKGSESDASSSSGDGSKKKRRRIKRIDDSDDASGSESETEGRNKHGRKNIRKVMGKNQLEEATKKAAREEKERIARIAERQKLYNNLQFDESGKPDEVVLDKVVLDFDPETKEPLIEVDKGLVKKLKPHQANGIKFMWDACFESVKRIKKDKGSGCILAHCMGLGKTLQVVSLTHTLLTHSALTRVRRVLVVCPLSTVLNWVNEFRIWLKHAHADYDVDVYELSRHKQNSERAWQLEQWVSGGGVCVLGYEMFRNLSADNSKKFKKKMLKSFQESLVDPGPDLVVCDEGHLLKNEKTSLSQAMNRVKTLRRIVLTGTPLQNNLKEYYCMVQFVKPNLLGKYNEYLNRFVNPITNGQYTDSTEHDIKIMKRRSHVLHKMLDGAVQRRDYGVLAPFLPPKHEYVLFITLTEVQIKLYQHYLDNYSRRPLPGKSSGFLFPDFQSLQRIWTHPLVLKYNSERYEIMQQKKREREEEEDSEGSLADFIDDNSSPDETSTEESSDSSSDVSDDSRKKSKKKKSAKKSKGKDSKVAPRRGTRANPIEIEDDDDVVLEEEVKTENPTEWWMQLVPEEELDDLRHSHKLVLLFNILRECEAIGDKLLVFSQSLYSLDLIEHFLSKVDEATQEGRVDEKLNGHVGSWSPGIDYFRLDGSTSCENRSIWCKNFNKEDNPRARLFLISTRAGGLGINLVAANRVVIFDVSWNPSHDVQSIFRVYRFGQKKPCYVYRFLAMGTMEEKIYERQVTKQAISKRVIDEQQIDRHYAENDLAELYKFEPRPPNPRELPPLPKDRLFAEMLKEHEAQIYKYHEHDSLLENKEEETLTEEERKAAWEDFENEKTRPPPAPFSAYMHNGMVPSLIQQQTQMAYATLMTLLQKEMPNATDAQIRDVLYRTNPAMFGGYDYGFLQKMGELYKYSQPGMMNPGMMNPAMNPVGGMSLGGSSGLQYEPPWQRQQQQQHNSMLRMQQMLQQQNSMGTKLYAGGLGSRDPVAMALQQQRARDLMLGERARPRGRPPRQHPPPTGDIVNLDSD